MLARTVASAAAAVRSTGTARAAAAAAGGSVSHAPVRFLNVHEYIGQDVLREYGVPVPMGEMATSAEDAEALYRKISEAGSKAGQQADVVIKAQVLAGGRGLGTFTNGFQGGVHVVTRPGQAKALAEKMLGQTLVTKQTGAEGRICERVLLMERLYMRREMYISILMDRAAAGPVIVASAQGGTSIEDVAEATPEAIQATPVDIATGPSPDQLSSIADFLGFTPEAKPAAMEAVANLYKMFIATDATLVEVNPLCETPDAKVFVADAKVNFDDNAAFRQPDLFALRDKAQEDAREVEAAKYDLNYIGLDGSIGCMVNGAGLAMASMDIISLHGGSPANFLDVGGGANEQQVEKAFEILNDDKKVKTILVNIFGGIMRCDVIAQGILNAAKNIGLRKPIVIRLQGTNVEQAKALIESSGYKMIMTDDLDDAAAKAVKMAAIVTQAEEISVGVSFELPL